jgi:hypothetical protein
MRAERDPYLLELTFCPFLILASSGMSLFSTSISRSSPRVRVGSKIRPLTLLFLSSESISDSVVAVERMRLAPMAAVPSLAM